MSIVHLPWRASKKGTAESWRTRDLLLARARATSCATLRLRSGDNDSRRREEQELAPIGRFSPAQEESIYV